MRGLKTAVGLVAAASFGTAVGLANAHPPAAGTSSTSVRTVVPADFPTDLILPNGRLREAFGTRLTTSSVFELTYDVDGSNRYMDAIGDAMSRQGWYVQQRGPFDNGNRAVIAAKAGRKVTLLAAPKGTAPSSALTLIVVQP